MFFTIYNYLYAKNPSCPIVYLANYSKIVYAINKKIKSHPNGWLTIAAKSRYNLLTRLLYHSFNYTAIGVFFILF